MRVFLIAIAGFALQVQADSLAPRIAIIIDDLGYERLAGERAISLPGPIAYAILPDTPRATYLAETAYADGKEVLLHIPLQAERDHGYAEPGSLLLDMSRQQFSSTFVDSFESIPHAIGVNNHRGSLLTRHPGHMAWLMEEIEKQGNLFFVDSYTTADSVALSIAQERGVPALKRDVFLDPDTAPGTLEREFSRLKKLARRQGYAVGIAHPYQTTLDYLETALPGLQDDGFDLVKISELIASTNRPAQAAGRASAE
jgi:polysaccharide deacetylase 2 family uncharacterized protein YibQ